MTMHRYDELHIVLIADNNYIMPTSVTLTSIIKNKKDMTKVVAYVVSPDINEYSKDMLMSLSRNDVDVKIIEADLTKYSGIHIQKENGYCVATLSALLKFDLPSLIEVDKILYLDGDIIVRKDLFELYSLEIDGVYCAAVLDSGKLYSGREIPKKCSQYINTGVMLLNLKRLRQENITDTLIRTKKNIKDYSLMDQDVFNIVFDGKILTLPIKYNLLYVNLKRAENNGKVTIGDINSYYGVNYPDLDTLRKGAVIIHYSSKDKPWKYSDTVQVKEWDEYYAQSPYAHIPLTRSTLKKSYRELAADYNKVCRELDSIKQSKAYKVGNIILGPAKFLIRKKDDYLLKNRYRRLQKPVVLGKSICDSPRIIVSMTSYPGRIKYVSTVVGSILHQSMKPDKILLVLAESQFPDHKLPRSLNRQIKMGCLEVVYTDDLGPHKKYQYAMKNYPADIIITVDDDVIYDSSLIKCLYDAHLMNPTAITANRTHKITVDEHQHIQPYVKWKKLYIDEICQPSFQLFATGCGGVLYPPNCMPEELFDTELIRKTCLFGDDLWLKVMSVMNNTMVQTATRNKNLEYINGSQNNGLFLSNVKNNENDAQLANILKETGYYDQFIDKLKRRVNE